MQVYKLFFQVLRKQKGQIIMYLVIFLSRTKKKSFRMRFITGVYRVFFGFQADFLNPI